MDTDLEDAGVPEREDAGVNELDDSGDIGFYSGGSSGCRQASDGATSSWWSICFLLATMVLLRRFWFTTQKIRRRLM